MMYGELASRKVFRGSCQLHGMLDREAPLVGLLLAAVLLT
jgi:hypothetical protein